MTDPERIKRLAEKAKLADESARLEFVVLDLVPVWMKCRRTKRLVFQFHRIGSEEGSTACGKRLKEFQILPDRHERMVMAQVNMMLGGLGLLVFFDLCPDCFGNVNRCSPLGEERTQGSV